MTKEEVLQKANEYCGEKGYTNETLTDEFKDKFSDFFAKKYPDTDISDENAVADLHFNLNTAFSATSRGITAKVKSYEDREKDYKRQIEEFQKKNGTKPAQQEPAIPEEVKQQIAELTKFKNEAQKELKFKEVLEMAKKAVRTDLHRSLENYANDFTVTLDASSEEQAKKLTKRFQEIFKDSIPDIRPFTPRQTQQRDDEFLDSLPKIKI